LIIVKVFEGIGRENLVFLSTNVN